MKQITILGIGNMLMQDEGFGVRVIEKLGECYQFPDFVQILDGGTLGMELMTFLNNTQKLIIVDAVTADKPPGSLHEFEGEEVKLYFKQKISLHELGVRDILTTLEVLERPIEEVKIIGIEPSVVEVGLELTDIVKPGVEKAVKMILDTLKNWQVEVKPNADK